MFKNISLGVGALAVTLTAGTLAMPQRAEARICKPTYIPYGFQPTTTPCGSIGCSGVIFTHPAAGSMCVITDFTL